MGDIGQDLAYHAYKVEEPKVHLLSKFTKN